jgi:hypothetical protein
MRNTSFIYSAFFILAFSVLGCAQNSLSSTKTDPHKVELPEGQDAWAVRVIRSGGLSGETFRDITVQSTGQLTIDTRDGKQEITISPDALSTISPDALRMLSQMVLSAKFAKSSNRGHDTAGCYDCYTTALTVRRRERNGKERTHSGVWVPTTVGSVPEDFVNIVQMVLETWGQATSSTN